MKRTGSSKRLTSLPSAKAQDHFSKSSVGDDDDDDDDGLEFNICDKSVKAPTGRRLMITTPLLNITAYMSESGSSFLSRLVPAVIVASVSSERLFLEAGTVVSDRCSNLKRHLPNSCTFVLKIKLVR